MNVPIEPFHTLLQTGNNKLGYTLWDTEMENIMVNCFVADDGKVTLSSRWNEKNIYFGNLKDTWKIIESSKYFKDLLEFKKLLFKKQSNCIFCSYYNVCGGFLKAVDQNCSCINWKNVFENLFSETKKAKHILKEYCENKIGE